MFQLVSKNESNSFIHSLSQLFKFLLICRTHESESHNYIPFLDIGLKKITCFNISIFKCRSKFKKQKSNIKERKFHTSVSMQIILPVRQINQFKKKHLKLPDAAIKQKIQMRGFIGSCNPRLSTGCQNSNLCHWGWVCSFSTPPSAGPVHFQTGFSLLSHNGASSFGECVLDSHFMEKSQHL